MTALVVTEPRHVPALGERDHAYPLVPGQRLEAVERRGIVWHARRLLRGRPVEPVLVVPRVFVREEEPR